METEGSSAVPEADQVSTEVGGSEAAGSSHESLDLYQYEAQHFGFTPTSFINGMFNSVCDLYRDALKAFAKACHDRLPSEMSEDELTAARHAVGEMIDKDICTVFDALEHYLLANVFSIPEDVVLREDRCQLSRLSEGEETQLDRRKTELRKKIIAVKYANAKLNQHLEESNALQASLDEVINKLSSSSDSGIAGLNAESVADWISYYSDLVRKATENH